MILPFINRKIISSTLLQDDWEGSIVDLLDSENILFDEKLQIIAESDLLSWVVTKKLVIWFVESLLKIDPNKSIESMLNLYKEIEDKTDEISGKIPNIENPSKRSVVSLMIITDKKQIMSKISDLASKHLTDYLGGNTAEEKILWKIKDLTLLHLTDGNVAFILKNQRRG